MQILNSYLAGWKQLKKNWQLLFFFFVANLLFALLISLPLQSALVNTFGHSRVAQELLIKLHLNNLQELFKVNPLLFQQLKENFFYSVFIYFVLTLFFTGGAIKVFSTRKPYFSVYFFLSSGLEYWARMIRLFLLWVVCVLFLGALFLALNGIISNLLETHNEVRLFHVFMLLTGVGGLFFLFLSVFFDYTRIILVVEETQIFSALKKTLAFFWNNALNSVGLYLLIFGSGLFFTGIYWLLSENFHFGNGISVVLIFGVQQLYILIRAGIRLLFFAGQVQFYISQKRPAFQENINSEILTV